MVEIKERPGMTDSALESCSPSFDNRANDSVDADERPKSGNMSEELNEPAENGEDLEEGEISDDVEGEESASKEDESKENENSNIETEPATGLKNDEKSGKRSGKRDRDSKHDRRSKREERREERREKRRRDDDGRDRSRKRRREEKEGGNKKHEEAGEHYEEEDEEMLFVRGASPSRAHPLREDGVQNNEPITASENQTSPSHRDGRNKEERPRRRSRSRSRNRQEERPRDKDRERRDRDRDRDRGRDARNRRDRERDVKNRPPKSNELCIMFMEGRCIKGEDCRYSHNGIPQRKMELCKFYMQDCCAKKDKCLYMHKDFPCKYHHTGSKKCRLGDKQCKFSHAPLTDVTKNILRRHLETAPKEILGEFSRPPKRDDGGIVDDHPNMNKKMHIPSIFELNVRPPPGLGKVVFREEEDESPQFSFTPVPDDDDDEDGLQIDLGDTTKNEEEGQDVKGEATGGEGDTGEVGGGTPVPENEYSSEDDGPKSLAEVVKNVNDKATVPASLPNIPLPAEDQPKKLDVAAALAAFSLSAEQLTEMLEMVKSKSTQQQVPANQSPQHQPTPAPSDPRRRPPLNTEISGGTSPSAASALPARDPRLARDPRQRVDPRTKPSASPSTTPSPAQPKTVASATLNIPVKQESAKTGDVDLRGQFVLPPLTLSDKDYRQSDIDMRSLIGQAPINPFSSDVDLRTLPDPLSLLPFRPAPMHPPAREIDASLMSHPPLEWKVRPFNAPKPDYSHVKFNPSDPKARLDPRLQRYFKKEIEDSIELPGLSSPPVYTPQAVYNPALEKTQVPVYDPRADLNSSESFAPQRFDPRLVRR